MEQHTRILKVLQRVSGKQLSPSQDESLFASGVLDSFALTDFVCGLEEEFGVTVPDSDLSARKFDTIDKVACYLSAKQRNS